jgi:hypothetical protein
LELQYIDSLESYILQFEDLQYQVSIHNSDFGELFFVTQFIRGLKIEINSVVQSQIPDSMERAILLARIQQQVMDKGKSRWQRTAHTAKVVQQMTKGDNKVNNTPPNLWRERQTRDYRRANGLCYFCVEPYDACYKRWRINDDK